MIPSRGRALRRCLIAAAVVACTCWVAAHVRLRNPSNGSPLYWLDHNSISIVLSSKGSDDLDDASHMNALRGSIAAWNEAPGSEARLVEDESPDRQARDDWQSDSLHMIWFDESDSSGYFPPGSGIVAVTPVYFFSSGRIEDADVLFNGEGFHFTTSQHPGRFDVEDIGAHELGHLLGLDHSGWAGATMYPYVDPTILLHRSLSLDDQGGMRDMYPDSVHASIGGRVLRASDDSAVRGAHLVARDASGRPVAAILSDHDGTFALVGLDAGTYEIYAAPLDGPVTGFNLSSDIEVDVDFGATHLGSFTLADEEALDAGSFVLRPDVPLSAGRVADEYPLRVVRGETQTLRVRGSDFDLASTIVASDPSITIASAVWTTTSVQFEASVPAGVAPGHVDLEIETSTGELAIVTAALEITPPDPLVSLIQPSSSDSGGGSTLTISGAFFQSGLRVVIGDRIYEEGVVGGATLVDSSTLSLLLGPTIGGLHDVVVIDSTGVEGRLAGAFLAIAQPAIASVFPAAGTVHGGTLVTLWGANFAPGLSVSIDGVVQTSVALESTQQILVTTETGRAGGPYALTVTNPGGGTSSSTFTYVASPDPMVSAVDPDTGSVSGGETVLVRGTNLTPMTRVIFGADALTGAGGLEATEVVYVDAHTLEVLTPSMGSGAKSVMVADPATDQASILDNGFTYTGSSDDGGSCMGIVAAEPPRLSTVLANAGWIPLLLAIAACTARRRALPRPALRIC